MNTTSYQTGSQLSVTLTGRDRVVVTRGSESVATQHNIVLVTSVPTTGPIETSGHQEVNSCGGMTGNVVLCTLFPTTWLQSVTLAGIDHVVIVPIITNSMESAVTRRNIALVRAV